MEAIAQRYGVGRAAVRAVNAGADMVLVPWRQEKKTEVYEALLAATARGEIAPGRLDEAVRRILTAKLRRDLFAPPPLLEERLSTPPPKAHAELARRIARQVRHPAAHGRQALPPAARGAPGRHYARGVPGGGAPGAQSRGAGADRARVAFPRPARGLRQQARALAEDAEVVVVGVINSHQLELVTLAAATGRPVVVVSMGLPYLAERVEEARAVLAVYSYQPAATEAAAAALFGEIGTPGRLPVGLEQLTFGHGLEGVGAQR
jgi:beta-N-acetylhexosaminidase